MLGQPSRLSADHIRNADAKVSNPSPKALIITAGTDVESLGKHSTIQTLRADSLNYLKQYQLFTDSLNTWALLMNHK